MPKPTRMQLFADVPEEIRPFSHFAVKQLAGGGWFVSIRRIGKPIESRAVETKEELAALVAYLGDAGIVGAYADVDRTEAAPDPEEQVFAPPANPLNIRRGRSNPYKDIHAAFGTARPPGTRRK